MERPASDLHFAACMQQFSRGVCLMPWAHKHCAGWQITEGNAKLNIGLGDSKPRPPPPSPQMCCPDPDPDPDPGHGAVHKAGSSQMSLSPTQAILASYIVVWYRQAHTCCGMKVGPSTLFCTSCSLACTGSGMEFGLITPSRKPRSQANSGFARGGGGGGGGRCTPSPTWVISIWLFTGLQVHVSA